MPVSMPTVAQVDEQPALMEKAVPPEWQDQNGHVNVRHYLELYDAASWPKLAEFGLAMVAGRSGRLPVSGCRFRVAGCSLLLVSMQRTT